MLSRGLFDAMSAWPVAFWPLAFSTFLFAFIRLCQLARETYGVSALDGDSWGDKLAVYVQIPAGLLFNVLSHAYLIYVSGFLYLVVAIPIYVLGWVLLPWLLDGFRPALAILAAGHLIMATAFLVLIGIIDIGPLRALNAKLYVLLTGLPIVA